MRPTARRVVESELLALLVLARTRCEAAPEASLPTGTVLLERRLDIALAIVVVLELDVLTRRQMPSAVPSQSALVSQLSHMRDRGVN